MNATLVILGLAFAAAPDDGSQAAPPAPAAIDVRPWLPLLNTEVLVETKDGGFVAGLLEGVAPSEIRLRLANGTSRTIHPVDVASVTAKPGVAPAVASPPSPAPRAPVARQSKNVSGPPERLLELLLGKQVTVRANDDVRVRGRLLSFDDDSIEIDSDRGRFEIERSAVTKIEEGQRASGRLIEADGSTGDRATGRRGVSRDEERRALDEAQKHADASVMWFSSAGIMAVAGALSCILSWYVCGVPLLVAGGGLLLGAGVSAVVGFIESGTAGANERKAAIAARRGEMAY